MIKFTYLLVNLCAAVVPFIFSFHYKIRFDKKFSSFIKANLLTAVIFIAWDMVFTRNGVWSFNNDYTLGFNVGNLPLEEVLFFICIPFACMFTYHCFKKFFNIQWSSKIENIVIYFFSIFLIIVGLIFSSRLYTSVTFIGTGILLLMMKYFFKVNWLPKLFTVFPVLLLPFFIVNGILTGSWINEPVVIYNDAENLGIRMLTIPVEDVVYGFELILLNAFFFERFERMKNS